DLLEGRGVVGAGQRGGRTGAELVAAGQCEWGDGGPLGDGGRESRQFRPPWDRIGARGRLPVARVGVDHVRLRRGGTVGGPPGQHLRGHVLPHRDANVLGRTVRDLVRVQLGRQERIKAIVVRRLRVQGGGDVVSRLGRGRVGRGGRCARERPRVDVVNGV